MNHSTNFWMVVRRDAAHLGQQIEVSEASSFEDMKNYQDVCGSCFTAEIAMYPVKKFTREQALADYQQWYC